MENKDGRCAPGEESQMELLRQSDRRVTQRESMIAAMVGVIGSLAFGIGLCCTTLWCGFFVVGIVIAGVAAVIVKGGKK